MIKNIVQKEVLFPWLLAANRILSGGIICSFGLEIFDAENMEGYGQWLKDLGMPMPILMAYIGKVAELLGGVCLVLGFYTRLAAIPLVITMIVITFIMSDGSIRTGSFYLLVIFTIYLSLGSGRLSVDHLLHKRGDNT